MPDMPRRQLDNDAILCCYNGYRSLQHDVLTLPPLAAFFVLYSRRLLSSCHSLWWQRDARIALAVIWWRTVRLFMTINTVYDRTFFVARAIDQ